MKPTTRSIVIFIVIAIAIVAFALGFRVCDGEPPPPCELECPDGPLDPVECVCLPCPDGTDWNGEECVSPPPPPPPPPPCVKPPKPPGDCEWKPAPKCKWDCDDDSSDADVPGPGLSVYMRLTAGEEIVHGTNSKNPGLRVDTEDLEVNGRQGIVAVLGKCPWAVKGGTDPFFTLTAGEMAALSVEAGTFVKESRQNYQKRLLIPNKRCDEDHAEYHPLYCKRSDVRKKAWKEWHAGFSSVSVRALGLESEIAHCREPLRASCTAVKPPFCEFDSIRGWCAMMRREGRRSCP